MSPCLRLAVLLAGALVLAGCAPSTEAWPPTEHATFVDTRRFDRAIVYDPAGRVICQLDREPAHRLAGLIEAGKVPRKSTAGHYYPLSYSVGFSQGASKKWSFQFRGRAEQGVQHGGQLLVYTKVQRREILALIDPQRRRR